MWAEYRLLGAAPGGGNLALDVRTLFMKPQLTGREVLLDKLYILKSMHVAHTQARTHMYTHNFISRDFYDKRRPVSSTPLNGRSP